MGFGQLLSHFFHDGKVEAALAAIAIDFVLGVAAAAKLKIFRLSYVSDFLRNDVLGKLLPYFVLYSGSLLAGSQDIVIPGLDLGLVAGAVYVAVMAAWVGSIMSSLAQLGLVKSPAPGAPVAPPAGAAADVAPAAAAAMGAPTGSALLRAIVGPENIVPPRV